MCSKAASPATRACRPRHFAAGGRCHAPAYAINRAGSSRRRSRMCRPPTRNWRLASPPRQSPPWLPTRERKGRSPCGFRSTLRARHCPQAPATPGWANRAPVCWRRQSRATHGPGRRSPRPLCGRGLARNFTEPQTRSVPRPQARLPWCSR